MVGAIEGQGGRGLNPTTFNKVPTPPTHYELCQLKTTYNYIFQDAYQSEGQKYIFSHNFKTKTYIPLILLIQ